MKMILSAVALMLSFSAVAQGSGYQFDYYAKETIVFAKVTETEFVSIKRSKEGRYGLTNRLDGALEILETESFKDINPNLSLNLMVISNDYILWLDHSKEKGFESSGKIKRSFLTKQVLSLKLVNKMNEDSFDKDDEKEIKSLIQNYPLRFGSKYKMFKTRSPITCYADGKDQFVCEHELRVTIKNL